MKKGFTLVELLGVIIIIGVIALITMPILTNTISQSEEKAYKKQINLIETAAKEWGVENIDFLPTEDSNIGKAISLQTLLDSGKIQNTTIQDPRTREEMNGCVVVKYNSEYQQYEYKFNEDTSYCQLLSEKICVFQGTNIINQYELGSEYLCKLGDGVIRTFYVLEDGDNPTLIKGDGSRHNEKESIGTAGDGELSLIMNQNIVNNVPWCSSGKSNLCNADGARSYLNSQTSNWTDDRILNIDLPTYAQIYSVNSSSNVSSTPWLYDYLNGTTHSVPGVYGYWTSTYDYDYSDHAYTVYGASTLNLIVDDTRLGVRPVITISKNSL